jgi:hypothetical protein
MIVSHIIISDSFTREPRAVAVSFSDAARRANLAALLREYRARGFKVRTVETGAMYRAESSEGYFVNVWYATPNVHKFAIISAVKTA